MPSKTYDVQARDTLGTRQGWASGRWPARLPSSAADSCCASLCNPPFLSPAKLQLRATLILKVDKNHKAT